MASLKRTVRTRYVNRQSKEDISTDGVIELSVTVGYLAADVRKEEMGKLKRLLHDQCVAGVVALERGDLEQHLHFQMVRWTRVKSARAFGALCHKCMDWAGKTSLPTGKVMCKSLTNCCIHTWKGMIGYCLKDSGTTHFDVAMHNISDDEVVAGKTLHSIYGKADLKSRVIITNKNIGERAYVWFKYKEDRQLTATLLSTLTDMINSAMFIPTSSWIIPFAGQGMDQRRMNSFWICLIDPSNVDRADVADVFIRKREYVKGRYFDDDIPTVPNVGDEYHFQESPPSVKAEQTSGVDVSPSRPFSRSASVGVTVVKDELRRPTSAARSLPRALHIPPLGRTPLSAVLVKNEVPARNVSFTTRKKLFREVALSPPKRKSVTYADVLGDFIPLKDIAPLPTNVFLPTSTALSGAGDSNVPLSDADFWDSIRNSPVPLYPAGERHDQTWKGKQKVTEAVAGPSSAKTVPEELKEVDDIEIIVLSSDSESSHSESEPCVRAAPTFQDRTGGLEKPPLYDTHTETLHAVKEEPVERVTPPGNIQHEVLLLSSESDLESDRPKKRIRVARIFEQATTSASSPVRDETLCSASK